MRKDKRFSPLEWLTTNQIKFLFSKISANIRRGTAVLDSEEDALQDEIQELNDAVNESDLVEDITNRANADAPQDQSHPITVC